MKLLFLMCALSGDAQAKKNKTPEGVNVVITVLDDQSKAPVSTAIITHPKDVIDHKVNEVTGIWKDSQIFLPNGEALYFSPGLILDLTITAPGYITQDIRFEVKQWRNKHTIYLNKITESE